MENKHIPHLDKLVGVPSGHEETKKKVEEALSDRYQHSNEKYTDELEKSSTELLLIDFAQKAADEILSRYGREKLLNLSPEHIHIFKNGGVKEFTEGNLMEGGHSTIKGNIIVERKERMVDFVLVLFHEIVHAKSFNAAQIIFKPDSATLEAYRSGFSAYTRDGKSIYFRDINEAIVGWITKKFYEEYVRNSEIFMDEIREIDEGTAIVETNRQEEIRAGLEYINKLYERNKDQYSHEDILNIFLDAGINGNLIKVARLIENTFGKGSFRELGEKTGYKKLD